MSSKQSALPHILVWGVNYCIAAGFTTLWAPRCEASITLFQNNLAGWQAAVGQSTTLDFVEEGAGGYVLFDHFASVGVLLHFPVPFDPAVGYWYRFTNEQSSHLSDAGGIATSTSPPFPLSFRFLTPTHGFAFRHLDNQGSLGASFTLWNNGAQVGAGYFQDGPTGPTHGLYSTAQFDELRFTYGMVYLDNIYFQTTPAPSAIALLALAAPFGSRRRGG